jgi:hypothetical protein
MKQSMWRSLESLSYSRNFQSFMEPEHPLQSSQGSPLDRTSCRRENRTKNIGNWIRTARCKTKTSAIVKSSHIPGYNPSASGYVADRFRRAENTKAGSYMTETRKNHRSMREEMKSLH